MKHIVIIALAVACSAPPRPVSNTATTGSAPSSADHRIDRSSSVVAVIDLQPPRSRSYYGVYVVSEAAAGTMTALIPRPDEHLAAACRARTELTDIAKRARLCDVAVSEGAFVDRINRLPLDDGLRIKRVLERALKFNAAKSRDGYWSIWPFPNSPDVHLLCQRTGRSGLSEDLCEFHSPQHTTEEMRFFNQHDTETLAKQLNELYGPVR